jgi:hypothetical protein
VLDVDGDFGFEGAVWRLAFVPEEQAAIAKAMTTRIAAVETFRLHRRGGPA